MTPDKDGMGQGLGGDDPCPRCDDSGYVETYHGGVWLAGSMRTSMAFCDCICGVDAREESDARAAHILTQGSKP